MLELFHALLNSSFVIDESFARIAHDQVMMCLTKRNLKDLIVALVLVCADGDATWQNER
jgi:hypothetical protein